MKQSKADSFMEATTNTAIGFVLSMITWHFVALGFGIPMPLGENLQITGIFTVVSLTRAYVLRRAFDGRTVWQALKGRFGRQPEPDLTWPTIPVPPVARVEAWGGGKYPSEGSFIKGH